MSVLIISSNNLQILNFIDFACLKKYYQKFISLKIFIINDERILDFPFDIISISIPFFIHNFLRCSSNVLPVYIYKLKYPIINMMKAIVYKKYGKLEDSL